MIYITVGCAARQASNPLQRAFYPIRAHPERRALIALSAEHPVRNPNAREDSP
jgi:hypothetical protein